MDTKEILNLALKLDGVNDFVKNVETFKNLTFNGGRSKLSKIVVYNSSLEKIEIPCQDYPFVSTEIEKIVEKVIQTGKDNKELLRQKLVDSTDN